jgi:hypothetical protein
MQRIRIKKTPSKKPNSFAMFVDGDSMPIALIEIRPDIGYEGLVRLLTQRAADGSILSPIERDWSGEVEDEAWAYLHRPAANANRSAYE